MNKVPLLLLGSATGALMLFNRRRRSVEGLENFVGRPRWGLRLPQNPYCPTYPIRMHRGLAGLAMADDAHGKEVIRLAEQAHESMNAAEAALRTRRSKKSCKLAFNKLRDAYTPIIAAKEQAGSVGSGRAKYDELVSNAATDYTNLQEQVTKRCGMVEREFKYKWGRKCIQWYKRKKKGRRICKKYKRIRRR